MDTAIGVVGAIGALATAISVIYLALQTGEARKASDLANRLAALAAFDRLTDLALQADSFFIERPELRKYFYSGEDHRSADRVDQERITAVAEFMSDFMENALVHEDFLKDLTISSWRAYYYSLVRESPAIREFLHTNGDWYDPSVKALLHEVDQEVIAGMVSELEILELPVDVDGASLAALRALYLGAFPEYERLNFRSVFVDRDGGRHVLIARSADGGVVALAVLLPLREHSDVYLLEYLAVAPRLRSAGVGKLMLESCGSYVQSRRGNLILMEVEDPDVGESSVNASRRWNFYTQNGVTPVDWIAKYWMPDLAHQGRQVPMRLMEMRLTREGQDTDYRGLVSDLYCSAYGDELAGDHLPELLEHLV